MPKLEVRTGKTIYDKQILIDGVMPKGIYKADISITPDEVTKLTLNMYVDTTDIFIEDADIFIKLGEKKYKLVEIEGYN